MFVHSHWTFLIEEVEAGYSLRTNKTQPLRQTQLPSFQLIDSNSQQLCILLPSYSLAFLHLLSTLRFMSSTRRLSVVVCNVTVAFIYKATSCSRH